MEQSGPILNLSIKLQIYIKIYVYTHTQTYEFIKREAETAEQSLRAMSALTVGVTF